MLIFAQTNNYTTTMKHILMTLLLAILSMTAGAQSAETLYKQGKAFYDAKKYEQAVPKLRAAAEKGHKKAQYRLGRCYDKGRGVDENNTVAVQWYQKSANQGYYKAQYQMGKAYMKGKGVAADEQKARSYLKKAISHEKGSEIMAKMKQEAREGDEDAKRMLQLLK